MKTFTLLPTDGHKSLNNHHVNQYEVNGETISDLIRYTTKVASYNHATNEMSVYNCKSNTTLRHLKAFFVFYGFDTPSKKQLIQSIK